MGSVLANCSMIAKKGMRPYYLALPVLLSILVLISCHPANLEPTCQGCSLLDESSKLSPVSPSTRPPDIPGNPKNAVHAMKRIYKAFAKYRDATGHLPARQQILRDLVTKPAHGIELSEEDVICIDAKSAAYSESKPVTTDPSYMLTWNTKRPDGSKKPESPAKGERDLWAYSNHYKRGRYVNLGGKYSQVEYYGFAIGLFSDGTVVVARAEDLVAVRRGSNSWNTYFPMETGVPKGAIPLNKMARLVADQHRSASTK